MLFCPPACRPISSRCWATTPETARRLFPLAPSHRLGALVEYARLPVAGRFHRALADAEMAASLLLRLEEELRQRHQVAQVSVALLCRIQRASKAQLPKCLAAARGV